MGFNILNCLLETIHISFGRRSFSSFFLLFRKVWKLSNDSFFPLSNKEIDSKEYTQLSLCVVLHVRRPKRLNFNRNLDFRFHLNSIRLFFFVCVCALFLVLLIDVDLFFCFISFNKTLLLCQQHSSYCHTFFVCLVQYKTFSSFFLFTHFTFGFSFRL